MPSAVGIFLAKVGTAIFTGLLTIGLSEAAALFVLDVGVKLAGLALLGAIAEKLGIIPDLSKTAKNNLVTVRGTIEHQRLIYGQVLVSGPLWYLNSAGSHNQSLYHAIIVAGHEIDDITDVWFDDQIIPEASIDWSGNGSVDSGWLAGDTSLQSTTFLDKFLGTDNQSASPDLVAAFTEITSQHQGRNIAYFVARTDFFEGQTQVWSGGVPRNFRAIVRGKKVYNPNSDSTQPWGTGPHRLSNKSTWEWSDDPALCWADYMTDARLGFGEDSARIDYAYVASVYSINREVVFTPVGTDFRFRCNGTLSTGTTYEGNLSSILSAGNMTMSLVQGRWKLRGWEHEVPTLSFSDDDLRKDIQISLSTEENKRYNTVRAIFIDKDRRYQSHQSPAFTSSEFVARDAGETLFKDIQLPMTIDIFMSQRLQAGILEQSDLQNKVIYPSNFKTLPVEIGGTIMLSNSKMEWVNEIFRVTNYVIGDMRGIDLVLQEDNSGVYANVGTAEYTVSSGGVYFTASPGVPPTTSFTATTIPLGIRLSWTNPPGRLFEWIDVYESANDDWSGATLIASVRTDTLDIAYDSNVTRWFWLIARNFVDEVSIRTPDSDTSTITATATGGADGTNAATLTAFKRSASAPTDDPGTLTYTFATGAWTPANGWSKAAPAGSNPLYAVVASAIGTGATDEINEAEWTTPVLLVQDGDQGDQGDSGAAGAAGLNSATVFLFQRNTSPTVAPTLPTTASATYTFATGALDAVNNGWTRILPTSGDPFLWFTFGTAAGTGETDEILAAEWAVAELQASDGAEGQPGLPGASTITLYDNIDSSGAASSQGRYHMLTSSSDTSGIFVWATITTLGGVNFFSLHKDSTDGLIDHSVFYAQLIIGGIFTWWKSDRRWVSFRITSIEVAPADMFKWGISLISFDEADGNGNINSDAGNDVLLRFSQALTPSSSIGPITALGADLQDVSVTPTNAEAAYRVDNDGKIYTRKGVGSSFVSIGTWLNSGAAGDYEMQFEDKGTGNTTPTGAAQDTWISCSTADSNRTLTLIDTSSSGGNLTYFAKVRFRDKITFEELGVATLDMIVQETV